MKKSGLADSPFFHMPASQEAAVTPSPDRQTSPQETVTNQREASLKSDKLHQTEVRLKRKKPALQPGGINSDDDTMPPRHRDTMIPRYHATIIEVIRAAVKQFGKEAATHRWTPEEKKAVANITYTYKTQGIRTSENEIARIAVNFVVADYEENGENSILEQVLKALNE